MPLPNHRTGLSKSKFLAGLQCLKRLYLLSRQPEQAPSSDPWPSGAAGRLAQAAADFAQGVGRSDLTEKHGHELVPAREPFGASFGPVTAHSALSKNALDHREPLRKATGNLYHVLRPPVCGRAPRTPPEWFTSPCCPKPGTPQIAGQTRRESKPEGQPIHEALARHE